MKGKLLTPEPSSNNMDVAIKIPRPTMSSSVEEIRNVLEEIKVHLMVSGGSPNVVRLIGVHFGDITRGNVKLVLEFCENGSLLQHIREITRNCDCHNAEGLQAMRTSDEPCDILCNHHQKVQTWWKQIAEGMDFLTTKNVLHGDLAARNCLLDANLNVKIADFGLSKKLYAYGIYYRKNRKALPWRGMALESLRSFQFSVKSDVWAFGVTMWEVLSGGCVPYENATGNYKFIQCLEAGFRLPRPDDCPVQWFELIERCWDADPNQRPTFSGLSRFEGQ